MRVVDLILKKRNQEELTKEEISFLISGYITESVPDYQISALLMAILFNGLSKDEMAYLTEAMLNSGEIVDLSRLEGLKVDKHSTGGVGDKTTLVVAPIVAACGLKVPKMSGRGLGHTGGTLDKLESIPNFNVSLSSKQLIEQVEKINLAIVGQTANIVPADKKLYALRDVTGTVDSIGLIAASIMSKKLASGTDYIVLDVKVGEGAFMRTLAEAQELANAMVSIGKFYNKNTVALITNMDEPLGQMVGNSLEVIEAIETLKGNGPARFTQLCYELSSELLLTTNVVKTKEAAIKKIDEVINSGKAITKFKEMIKYQGGDPQVINDYTLFEIGKNKIKVRSLKQGFITNINALDVGRAAMSLGAGRLTKDEAIDLGVGVQIIAEVGTQVNQGDVLAIIYGNGQNEEEAYQLLLNAFTFSSTYVAPKPVVLDIVN